MHVRAPIRASGATRRRFAWRLPSGWLRLAWGWICGLALTLHVAAVPPAPVSVEREAPWRIANFANDAGVERRMVFDLAFETNNVAWFAVSDGLYRFDGYHWRRFTAADGLPSGFVRSVSVTRDGSIWVGTDKGAGVFTGAGFDRRGTEGRLAGPNVRRIVETSDGALWFCCDRWPDATQSGGLTRLKGGAFLTFGKSEGLPSDHLLSLFEQSNGRVIALTTGGPAVLTQERWQPLPDAGYPTNDHTWAMRETPDGQVFAQAFNSTLRLTEAGWSRCRDAGSGRNAPFCVTREGAVIKAVQNSAGTSWFTRWDGEAFVPASAEVLDPGLEVISLKQAPDGAIWAIGRGTLLRWEYRPGTWEWRPDLPQPVFEDQRRRLWFADRSGTILEDQGQTQPIPDFFPPLIEDAQGGVWAAGKTGVVRWAEGRVEPISTEQCGIARLRGGVVEASGTVWIHGQNRNGQDAMARFQAGTWKTFGPQALENRQVLSIAADPRQGLWGVLKDDKTSSYELVRATEVGVVTVPIEGGKPRTHLPLLCASHTHLYLYAYNGLWETPFGERLSFVQVQTDVGGGFTRAASDGEVTVFLTQEGQDGRAAVLLRRPNEWVRLNVTFGEDLWLNREGWLTVADGTEFGLCQARRWSGLTHVGLPLDTTLTTIVRAQGGDFWLGTSHGVIHFQPGTAEPDTLLTGPKNLLEGSPGLFQARGITLSTPRAREQRYSFSWRLDSGPWSDYEDWPEGGLSLNQLPAGPHRLEARARDGLGNLDPRPASFEFAVRSLPIQDRHWFRPALAATGLAFALLSLALFTASQRLKKYAGGLETQVRARTIDLRRDIAERQRAEQAEREARRLLRVVLDTVPVRVFWKDRAGRYLGCNLAVATDAGLGSPEEIIGKTDFDLPWREQAAAYQADEQKVIETGQPKLSYEEPQTTLGGDRVWRRTSKTPLRAAGGEVVGVLGTFEDITERKRVEDEHEQLQAQLLQAQRMESVGRLAGGVAHDFNNMLQSILGNASLALMQLPADSPQRESLEEIQKSAERSAGLTRQLLAFARKQTIAPKVLDLNDTVSGMLRMLRRLLGEQLELVWKPGAKLWPVEMDPSQLDQILANLCLNARDAIQDVGRVILETANVSFDEQQSAGQPGLLPGDYVLLAVSDTGCGMERETLAQIFEPFFTTKDVGQGTGLGLATVYGIVKQNHGAIQVESEPGAGDPVQDLPAAPREKTRSSFARSASRGGGRRPRDHSAGRGRTDCPARRTAHPRKLGLPRLGRRQPRRSAAVGPAAPGQDSSADDGCRDARDERSGISHTCAGAPPQPQAPVHFGLYRRCHRPPRRPGRRNSVRAETLHASESGPESARDP